jgi:hypothetical protein
MPLGLFFGQAAKPDEKYQGPRGHHRKRGKVPFQHLARGRWRTVVSHTLANQANMKRWLLGFMLALSAASPALATELNPPASLPDPHFVDEVRLGGFEHSPSSPEKSGGLDLNAEILFAKPLGTIDQWWLHAREQAGCSIGLLGRCATR